MGEKKIKDDVVNVRRNQLTSAAFRVVGDKGYYNITVKDIAKEAGLSTGLVHYYFKDKQELLLNLLKEMNKNLKLYLNRALSESGDPEEKLDIFLDQAFELVKKEKDYFYILFDFWTQVNRNQRMKRANIRLFQSYRDECAGILKEGVGSGVFMNIDIDYTTAYIVSLVQGMIIQYVIDSGAFDYEVYTGRIKSAVKGLVLKK